MSNDLSLPSTFHDSSSHLGSDGRWLERAARDVIQSSEEYNDVRLTCRYLFPDKSILCELLSKRSNLWLAGFLDFLHKFNSLPRRPSAATDVLQQAKNIVDLCYSPTTFDPHWDGKYITSVIDSLLEPHQIAEKIDFDICTIFNQIPYTAWVRLALGHEDDAIHNILHQISGIRSNLSRKYQEIFGPDERKKAKLVMDALQSADPIQSLHPMTYWILSASFIHYEIPIKPLDGLQSLLDPIIEIFKESDRNVVLLVRRLDILSLRFQREFIHASEINWSKNLSTDFSFLDNLEQNSPKTIAKSLTETDCRSLQLHVDDIFKQNQLKLKLITKQWDELCDQVADCIIVDRGYLNSTVKIIEYLLEWRNYHSAASLIIGLQNVQISFDKFPEFQKLVDSSNNYWNLRKKQYHFPGLPWMFPLIRELRYKQEASLVTPQHVTEMFPFPTWISNVRYRLKQADKNVQDMDASERVGHSSVQRLNLGPQNEDLTIEDSPKGIIADQPRKITTIGDGKPASLSRGVPYSQSPQTSTSIWTTDQNSRTFWLFLLDICCISHRC